MHFMLRAKALVAFPGGFGTIDELFEALTLVQTGKDGEPPVVLVGVRSGRRRSTSPISWEEGLIAAEDVRLFRFAETADEAWSHIVGLLRRIRRAVMRPTLVLFDVDGTLVGHRRGAGRLGLTESFRAVFGLDQVEVAVCACPVRWQDRSDDHRRHRALRDRDPRRRRPRPGTWNCRKPTFARCARSFRDRILEGAFSRASCRSSISSRGGPTVFLGLITGNIGEGARGQARKRSG
jgi:hypothetical protein